MVGRAPSASPPSRRERRLDVRRDSPRGRSGGRWSSSGARRRRPAPPDPSWRPAAASRRGRCQPRLQRRESGDRGARHPERSDHAGMHQRLIVAWRARAGSARDPGGRRRGSSSLLGPDVASQLIAGEKRVRGSPLNSPHRGSLDPSARSCWASGEATCGRQILQGNERAAALRHLHRRREELPTGSVSATSPRSTASASSSDVNTLVIEPIS